LTVSANIRRINRLLQKIQETESRDALSLAVVLIGYRESSGKWEVHADLADGTGSQLKRITMECDTEEQAQQAADEIYAKHPPTGKKAQLPVYCSVDRMEYFE